MCGFTGKLCLGTPGGVSLEVIEKMTNIIQHRGPDEIGVYIDDWVGLGHARLSIIDLAGGAQPIHNEDKTLWIVYSGEIFNYIELRDELLKKGHTFYTSSDTEVIVHLYEEKGPRCLDMMNGQFAFAIWDSKERKLFLARDRVGIRPLHYTIQRDHLIFASEIKSIFMDPSVPRVIDPEAVNQVFTFWTTLSGDTIFEGIRELPPGHYMTVVNGQVSIRQYWDIPFAGPGELLDMPADRICEQIHELLYDAARIRMRADVPVGCYVSGGLDSSIIAALVVKHFNSAVRTFGIRFQEARFDEGEHQELIVSRLKVDHTEIEATNDEIGASFPDVLWHCEKPLLRTAPVPMYLLSGAVRKNGIKVVLTGEGADEIFGGYNIFREAKARHFLARQPESQLRRLIFRKLYPYIFKDSRAGAMQQSFFAADLDKLGDPLSSHMLRWHNTGRTRGFLSEGVGAAFDFEGSLERIRQSLPPSFDTWDPLLKAQYLEIIIFMSNYLLSCQGDRVAMAHSVEIRMPFLDFRLIEFMGRVPPSLKIFGMKEKYILKKTFSDLLPAEILKRDKQPYRAPISQSLFHPRSYRRLSEYLSADSLKSSSLFDLKKVRLLETKIRKQPNASEVDNMALAGILSTQIIHDRFIVRFAHDRVAVKRPDVLYDYRTRKQEGYSRARA